MMRSSEATFNIASGRWIDLLLVNELLEVCQALGPKFGGEY
jgi:hypothetical protein